MQNKLKLLKGYLGSERVKSDVALVDFFHSGLKVKADGLYIATSLKELINTVKACQDLDLPYTVLGLGTRFTPNQNYILGLVIKNRSDGIKIFGIKGKVTSLGIGVEEALVEVDSGVSLSGLVEFMAKQNLTGLESLGEEKGTLGGLMATDPGLSDLVQKIKILSKIGQVEDHSWGKITEGEVILSVIFKLKSGQK